ncbi:hypothetical protein HHK36_028943 [Tetracentron sinense]|uniref:Uncharacterized protein n=1 Tax=Tetracentron sinense TaxID=13715 RepID=A0A834Y6Q5_TETSI|nr:hypothetical protein HHK36_032884 [Tetracentron sinense]KAF8379507.1 hypothetical protein HHK36_028943 [Tetracentron sinense]
MGLDTELEFEKYCEISRSPKSGCPSHPNGSKAEERDAKGKLTTRSHVLINQDKDFTEISFGDYRSSSCKITPSGPAGLAGNQELKRGSIYQSSKAVRKMKKMGAVEGRSKMDLSRSSDTSLSFRIVDSLSQSKEDRPIVQQKRSSLVSLNSDPGTTSDKKPYIEPDSQDFLELSFRPPSPGYVRAEDASSDRFFDICLDSENRDKHSVGTIERGSMEDLRFRCDQTIGPLNDGNGLSERDTVFTLHKSLSSKVQMPSSPYGSESGHSKAIPRARFSPIRRLFDPIMKSKSQRSSSVSMAEPGNITTTGLASIRRNRTLRKSLLHDFANTTQDTESGDQFVKKGHHSSAMDLSPAHLHGLLKLEYRHGVPFFELSLTDPGDFLAAKAWRADNSLNWLYTFHSRNKRRKSDSNGWGAKERHKESSMVGQMQVFCYLCSEMKNGGAFDNSMVTEFVSYDIAHARKSFAAQESSHCSPDSVKPPKSTSSEDLIVKPPSGSKDVSDPVKPKLQTRHASGNDSVDASTSYPWAPEYLHPNLEIAAIVIEVPFEMRKSLEDKQGVKVSDKTQVHPKLLDFSVVEQRMDGIPDSISQANMKAVIPTGTHGFPSSEESGGPSSLLDRWRSAGGCDCGGWDMACPLVVFGNPSIEDIEGHSHVQDQWPVELFVQGAKEKVPALIIRVIGEGQYSVDFHARLSTLQAFSICVAILHSAEVSTAVGQEKNRQRLQCSSLKVLLEEEVKFLIEAVAEEGKRKVTKRTEEIPPSFVFNPPFSPIGRV